MKDNRAERQAKAKLSGIQELMRAYDKVEEQQNEQDSILEDIQNYALDVQIREGFHSIGQEGDMEYALLLCTGGPAVRVRGDLDQFGYPISAILEFQDWFTSWEGVDISIKEEEILVRFASFYYFMEN